MYHSYEVLFDLHFGYSWSPGSTLKEIGTRSALRLAQKASQTARWTALYTTSRPVSVTKAIGRQHNSTGKSHCVGLMFKTSRKTPGPGPAVAAASRRQPQKSQESQGGASRNTATDNRQPQPQTGRQKARLPFPRLRWHRKHFLGLSDSTAHQSAHQ